MEVSSSIEEEFEDAIKYLNSAKIKLSVEDQLKFYGLFKQAKVGPVNIPRPGIFDFAGRSKWWQCDCPCLIVVGMRGRRLVICQLRRACAVTWNCCLSWPRTGAARWGVGR